jgi:hypothetical protein
LTTPTGWSSFWAGLDGDFTSNTVEQTGTEADCSSGNPVYYAWYEMYPHGSANLSSRSYPVLAGDSMSAAVTYSSGSRLFTLTLKDGTKWTFTTQQRLNQAKLASAEAIIEAPSSGGVLPLADFGTADFTGSSLVGLPNLDPITMVTSSGTIKAGPPSTLSSSGGFSETWHSQ